MLKEILINEQKRLLNIKKATEDSIQTAPSGRLVITRSNGCVQYYQESSNAENKSDTSKRNNRIYIAKKEEKLARQLAQKSYDKKLLKLVDKRLGQIDKILLDYEDDEIEKIYTCEHIERQKLTTPIEEIFQIKFEKWINEPYEGKGFKEDDLLIMTNSGIRVRSKSEKILADYFDSVGIPYKYECPLYLEPYGIIYPDFTFLSPRTGEEVYWEHEGMMDNENYAKAAIKKIELYEKNNIYPGENLILTFETSSTALNTSIVKELAGRYLL